MSEFGSEFGFGGGDYGRLLFQPLPQTQKVFLFSQICGMVCDQPKFAIFDYKKESLRPIEIPQEIKQRLIGSNKEQIFDFDSLSDEEFDFPRSEFKFRIGTTKDAAILNTNNLTWRLGNSVLGDKVFSSEPNQVFCNPSYQLEKNNGRFSELSCDQFLENSQYRWRYTTTDDKGLWQESKVTGERIKLAIPATRINKITYTQNRLWVGTDKGLAIFDPSTSEWKVLGVRDGLVSDEVFDFMVGEDVVWILTFWGGLSRVVF